MTFTLLPTAAPWIVAFFVIAAVGVALAVGAIADSLMRNRRIRTTRHLTLRAYYTPRLALHH